LEFGDRRVDVVAHEVELVMLASSGVHGQFGGWQGEDEPAVAGVDRREFETSLTNARTASASLVKMIAWAPVIMLAAHRSQLGSPSSSTGECTRRLSLELLESVEEPDPPRPASRYSQRVNAPRLRSCVSGRGDKYLRGVDEPKRSTLQALRRTILEIVPEAEQGSLRRSVVSRSGQGRRRLRRLRKPPELPSFNGSVLGQLADELQEYTMTRVLSTFLWTVPYRKRSCRKLIAVRLQEIGRR